MSLKGIIWAAMGPSPIDESGNQDNGLVSAIAIHPYHPDIIYIGTAGGGVWKTSDAGTSWSPLFDRQLSLGIGEPGALAIDPGNTDIIYAGTSSRITRQPQAGLFKSTDAGASWILLGSGYPSGNTGNATQFASQLVNVIIVDPANSANIYLASSSGVLFSHDGGQNWTRGSNAIGDTRSLVLDTTSPAGARTLYAGINSKGVFQSTDGGSNWTQILSGTTPAVAAAVGAGNSFRKTIVALAPPTLPPSPAGIQVLYVTLEGTGAASDPVGLFISKDRGSTWSQQSATGMPTRTQGGYSFHMAVDPASPGDGVNDIIYFGTVGQAKSVDSGVTFSPIGVPHADTHSWAFVLRPGSPSIVYCGNDGGIDKSTDGGVSWISLGGGGLQTGLFYNIDIRPDAAGSVTVGALQDNEIETTKGALGLGWNATQGGDGWDVAYDFHIPGQVYGSSGFWSPAPCTRVHLSTNDGATFPTEITPWTTATDTGCYLAPVTTDPSTGGILYVSGSQNLWQSRDGGGTWRILSPFPGTGNVDVAPADGNNVVIAVGGRVFVSTNALASTVGLPSGVTFTEITRNLPARNVARARFDPTDPTIVYAVLGGFSGIASGPSQHVFRTTVGASSWADISPDLDLPCNALALDGSDTPTTIYVGTDFGVLRSVDIGATWYVLDDIHFPRAPVLDLVYSRGHLRAATYGRGVFQFVFPTGPAISVDMPEGLTFGTVCKGPDFQLLKIYNVGVSDLIIFSVQRLMGSTAFSVPGTPGTPLIIGPGEEIDFTIQYDPVSTGTADLATIRIHSNDPGAPFVDLAVTGTKGFGKLQTAIADSSSFGNVCPGSFADQLLTINNSGSCPLSIGNITSSSPAFKAPGVAGYPLIISAGSSLDVVLRFQPTTFGATSAIITLFSDDPASPHTITVSGVGQQPRQILMMADSGNFGNCCIGSFVDKPLTVLNTGKCTLSIASFTSSSPDFLLPGTSGFPLTVASGTSLELPVRFQPKTFGAKSATLVVNSDDPLAPTSIPVSGNAPPGKIAITGSACFGAIKACCRAERTLFVCNVGDCPLHVISAAFSKKSRHWKLINSPFPAMIRPGSQLALVICYKATEKCPRCIDLIITSDDPENPVVTLELSAYTDWNCREKHHCDKCHKDECECGCEDACCDEDDED